VQVHGDISYAYVTFCALGFTGSEIGKFSTATRVKGEFKNCARKWILSYCNVRIRKPYGMEEF
jgi:hypothetical protein